MNASLTLVEVNNQIIQAMEGDLAAEEQDDAQLKAKCGPAYNRIPSD